MATPLIPTEPSTVLSFQDPNSITNILKRTEEQKKQAASDTRYDTKASLYEGFTLPVSDKALSILSSFLIAAGVFIGMGFLLRKK